MKRGAETGSLLKTQEMSNFFKRAKKTSKNQVEMYVKFLEDHPIVAMVRSNPTNDDKIGALWENLAFKLNSCEQGPFKTVQQWQETFANWRYQLRFKARKIIERTENGLGTNIELRDLEERAMRAFACNSLNDTTTINNKDDILIDIKTFSNSLEDERIPTKMITRQKYSSSKSKFYPNRTNEIPVDSTTTTQLNDDDDEESFDVVTNAELCEVACLENENDEKPNSFHNNNKKENFAQTDLILETELNRINCDSMKLTEIAAISRLENAVHSLNETLKSLVEIQSQILNVMKR